MSAKLKIKRGSTTSWADSTNKDTTLEPGQLGVEYLTDGNMRLKVGKHTSDGSATNWAELPYATPKLSLYTDSDGVYFNNGTHALWHDVDTNSLTLGDGVNNIWINGDTEVNLTGGSFNVKCGLYSDSIYLSLDNPDDFIYNGVYIGNKQVLSATTTDNITMSNLQIGTSDYYTGNITLGAFGTIFANAQILPNKLSLDLGSSSNYWNYTYSNYITTNSLSKLTSSTVSSPSGGTNYSSLQVLSGSSTFKTDDDYGRVENDVRFDTITKYKAAPTGTVDSMSSTLRIGTKLNGQPHIYTEGSTQGDLHIINKDTNTSSTAGVSRGISLTTSYGPNTTGTLSLDISNTEFRVYPTTNGITGSLGTQTSPWEYTHAYITCANVIKPQSMTSGTYNDLHLRAYYGDSNYHQFIFRYAIGFYSESSAEALGTSTYPWSGIYTSNLYNLTSFTDQGTTSGGTTNKDLSIQSLNSITFGDSKYGQVNSRILLKTRKSEKTSASGSASTYNGNLCIYSDGDSNGDTVVLELQDSGKSSSTTETTNTLVIKSVGDSKSSTAYEGYAKIQLMCDNFSGSTMYSPAVNIVGAQSQISVFPYNTSLSSYLGTSSSPWYQVSSNYTNTAYLSVLRGTTGIFCTTHLLPSSNSTSASTGYTLGSSSYKWRYVYAYSGTIQTSDRSAKDSIHYITQSNNDSSVMKAATMSLRSTSLESTSDSSDTSQVTIEDVIDFVSNLSPVTFCYKDGQGDDVEATEENSEPEDIQLGLIADDIKDHKLFKYVGVETTYEEEITPAVKDEEGNVVTEAVTETKTTLGLQAIPLATAALTACKYLIQKNEEIESRLAIIEEQLSELLNQ